MKRIILLSTLLTIALVSQAQTATTWNGKSCAVVLTYDDGLNVHLNNVIPALDSAGLKGTFYISSYNHLLQQQIPGWRKAAANGHELANHTIYHPCEGGRPGREFVTAQNDMNNYTVKRMDDEIETMNNLLYAIDGKTKRTFAYPCGDTKIHDTLYLQPIQNQILGARGVNAVMPLIDSIDLWNIPCYPMNGESGEQLINLVKKAQASHTLLVFLFHGVGGEHNLNVSLEAHSALLHYLKQQRDIWVAPMVEVADFIRERK
jgi:peptidoglycan/xylan/chitin deacetylase (PgdA/CDA1 family)